MHFVMLIFPAQFSRCLKNAPTSILIEWQVERKALKDQEILPVFGFNHCCWQILSQKVGTCPCTKATIRNEREQFFTFHLSGIEYLIGDLEASIQGNTGVPCLVYR